MPPSPGHGLGPQGARLTSSPTAGREVDTCGEAGAGKAASPQLCQRLAQALSPRLHPQTRLASRHLQRQPRARRAAAGKQGRRSPALECAGMSSGARCQAGSLATRARQSGRHLDPGTHWPGTVLTLRCRDTGSSERNSRSQRAGCQVRQRPRQLRSLRSTLRACGGRQPPRSGVRNRLQGKDTNTEARPSPTRALCLGPSLPEEPYKLKLSERSKIWVQV